jgi:hypothetical protein
MEAIGQLAGGVAHNFNNNPSKLFAATTKLSWSAMNPEDANRPHLEEVLRASHRASTLVRQLLVFSRCDRIERKNPFDESNYRGTVEYAPARLGRAG